MIGCPERNGIIERFFASIRDEEDWTTEYDTHAEAIDAWIDDYRAQRPHQSLDYPTPAEHRAAARGPTHGRNAA